MKLTQEEQKIVLKSLLFIGCVDCCLDYNDTESTQYIELAAKLSKDFNIDDLTDTNMYIYGDSIYENKEIVEKIKNNFKIRIEK